MPNFSMQAFAAAQFAGQQLNTELDNRRQDTEIKKQQVEQYKSQAAMQAQQQAQSKAQQEQMSKLINDFDQEHQAAQVANGDAPDGQAEQRANKEVERYRQMGNVFLLSDPTKASNFFKMADAAEGKKSEIAKRNLEIGEKRAKDTAAYAGSVLAGDVSPDEAFKWVRENVSLKDAMAIPTDPVEAKAWWRTKQTAGVSAEAQLANARQIKADEQREKDRKEAAAERRQNHLDAERDHAADRELRKMSIKMLNESRIAALAARADAAAEKKATGSAGGNIQYRNTVAAVNYSAEAVRGLSLVGEMAKGQASSVFGHLASGEGVASALAKTGGNRLSNEEQQIYQTATKGLGLELSQLATAGSGRGPNQAVTKELNSMVEVIPGDTQFEAMFKLANAADFVKTRLKSVPKSSDPTIQATREETDAALAKFPSPSSILKAAEAAKYKIKGKTIEKRQSMMEALFKAESSLPKAGEHPEEVQSLLDKYK